MSPQLQSLIRRHRIRRQRGAVFVEAVGVIVVLVLLWQLMWMMLLHYEGKMHASQRARQDVWKWAITKNCDQDANSIPAGGEVRQADEDDGFSSASAESLPNDPCRQDAMQANKDMCDGTGQPPAVQANGGRVDMNEATDFDTQNDTSKNQAVVSASTTYYAPVFHSNREIGSTLALECNNKGLQLGRVISETIGMLFDMVKPEP
jgi:hypothetical protein